jgi:hypothetical protein
MKAFPALVLLTVLTAISCSAFATTVGPQATVEVPMGTDTGIILRNLTDNAGEVTVTYIPGDPLGGGGGGGGGCAPGFVLLDGTLRVTVSGINPGDYRLLVKRAYTRTEARNKGARLTTMRPLLKRTDGVFRRCVDRLTGKRRCNVIFRRNKEAPTRAEIASGLRQVGGRRCLGLYGYKEEPFCWSVLDIDGDYGIGGLLIPEPSSLACLMGMSFMAGGGIILRRARRKG